MTRKEKVDLVLSKVAEDRKEDFIADFRKAGSKEERKAVLKKYGASLTKEEAEAFCKNPSGISVTPCGMLIPVRLGV